MKLWSWHVSFVPVWVALLRKLLVHLLQRRWSEENGISSMFPLLHDAQVNGFNQTGFLDYLWISFLIVSECSPAACCVSSPNWNRRREDAPTPAASGHTNKLTTEKSCSHFFFCFCPAHDSEIRHEINSLLRHCPHDFTSVDVWKQISFMSTNATWITATGTESLRNSTMCIWPPQEQRQWKASLPQNTPSVQTEQVRILSLSHKTTSMIIFSLKWTIKGQKHALRASKTIRNSWQKWLFCIYWWAN